MDAGGGNAVSAAPQHGVQLTRNICEGRLPRIARVGEGVRHARTGFDDLLKHFKVLGEGESVILVRVHPAASLEGQVSDDFRYSPAASQEKTRRRLWRWSNLD